MYPFNYYLMPSDRFPHHMTNVTFNTSTMHFLTANNFDWGKAITQGIPFWQLTKQDTLNELCKKKTEG